MANRRILVKRRKAVRNIRKITRTMQLIATARFQAAFNRAMATKPYTRKLAELVAELARAAGAAGDIEHPLLASHDDVKRAALVVLTSSRGLAGAFNASVLRAAVGHLDQQAAKGIETDVHMVGKKGISYFRFLRRKLAEQSTDIGEKPRYEQVEPIANALIERYSRGEIAAAHVAYMRFLSPGQQRPVVLQLLPLTEELAAAAPPLAGAAGKERTGTAGHESTGAAGKERTGAAGKESTGGAGHEKTAAVLYEFSPAPRELLDELLPAVVRVRLFQAFTDAAVS
jgi:F-type H+-transporting ATPase subunit gamma